MIRGGRTWWKSTTVPFELRPLLFVQWLTSSQFPKMEFEADLFSIQNPQGQSMTPRVQSMCGGLRRFAAIYPAELTRKGGPHPSLFDRITRLERQDLDSASAS